MFFIDYISLFNHLQSLIEERRIWKNGPLFNQELECKIFEKIITLLFPQEIDAQDTYGQTLLTLAIKQKNELAVQFLLEQGVNPNIVDKDGFTPLWYAYEQPKITSLLLTYKSDVNQRNSHGVTALMAPTRHLRFSKETSDLLLKAGADINQVDDYNKSALHYYAQLSWCYSEVSNEIVSMFIQKGAKIDLQDNQGKTPLDYARENNNDTLVQFLTDALNASDKKMNILDNLKL